MDFVPGLPSVMPKRGVATHLHSRSQRKLRISLSDSKILCEQVSVLGEVILAEEVLQLSNCNLHSIQNCRVVDAPLVGECFGCLS